MSNCLAAAALAVALSAPAVALAQDPRPPTPPPPPAAPAADEDAERKALEEQLRREMGRSREPTATAEARAGAQPAPGGNPLARLLVLPDISAIGSASGSWENRTDKPAFAFEELELALQSVVDPYVRADLFVAFSEEGAEIEEAFVTTLALPASLQLRAGKFFTPFGRLNQQHPHVWEFIDAPLAHAALLGGEEALGGAGVDVAWLAPVRWFAELRVAAQNVAVEEEGEARLLGTARLLNYFPITEAATLGVGVSVARRDEAPGQFRDLGGVDLYLRIRPLESRSYLTVSGELYERRLLNVPGVSEDFEVGGWVQAFGRMGRFFGAGIRWEQAPAADGGDDRRLTALLAWLPSEFQRVRLQVSRDRLADDSDAVSALLNVEFGIGAHGAHPF